MFKWLVLLAVQMPVALLSQFATSDRVSEPSFWPTQTRYARDLYAGESSCAQCHEPIVRSAQLTPMARAAMRTGGSSVLNSNPNLTFTESGYRYAIHTELGNSVYSVVNGLLHESAAIDWAFGSNGAQSWLYKKGDGEFHEARVTYFQSLQALNITPNRAVEHAQDIDEAMGRTVGRAEVYRCFACHATESGTGISFDESKLIPGVKCEACHGPGGAHIELIERGSNAGSAHGPQENGQQRNNVSHETRSALIFDPKKLSAEESVDFCGACHGSYWDITLDVAPSNVGRVRFEPYRLEQSKCWKRSDARLTCVACHDPHKPLDIETTHYDRVCLSCHLTDTRTIASPEIHARSVCHVAKNNCVSCHMPQVYVPAARQSFPDHRIRIAHDGEPFPD